MTIDGKFSTKESLLYTMNYVNDHLCKTFGTGCSDDLCITLGMVEAKYESLKEAVDKINELIHNLDSEQAPFAKFLSQELKDRLKYHYKYGVTSNDNS